MENSIHSSREKGCITASSKIQSDLSGLGIQPVFIFINPLCEMAFLTVNTVIIRKMGRINPRLKSEAHRKEALFELFEQFFSLSVQFHTTGFYKY